jgi:hypothetical protein
VVSADHRSVHPSVPGVPWWGGVLIALTATAIGFAYDAGSGDKQLTNVFAALYVIGCVAAVLAVRRAAIFTAVVQPPLILFVSVPGAYWLFHGAQRHGLRDIVIDCGYPLIERFLLMLVSAAVVLLIGAARWYFGKSKHQTVAEPAVVASPGRFSALANTITTKITGLFALEPSEDELAEQEAPRRRHAMDRASAAPAPATGARPAAAARRPAAARSRHARPPLTEVVEPPIERPRRQRASPRQAEPPPEPSRRRASAAREGVRSRDPHERRDPYQRRDPYPRRDPYQRPDPYERRASHDRRNRYDGSEGYDAFEPYEPPSRRGPGINGSSSYSNSTHHPISQVRYRGSVEERDEPLRRRAPEQDDRPEQRRPEQRRSGRRSRTREAETWEYDI